MTSPPLDTAKLEQLLKRVPTNPQDRHRGTGIGLPKLNICIGSRVRFTRNHCTQLGIFQGSIGTVVRIGYAPKWSKDEYGSMSVSQAAKHNIDPPLIYVQLDSALDVIKKEQDLAKKEQREPDPSKYPFPSAHESLQGVICVAPEVQYDKIEGVYERWMPSLLLAHSTTFHKSQGTTAFNGVVVKPPRIAASAKRNPLGNTGPPMGLCYVGISRATKFDNIVLLDTVSEQHFTSRPFERQEVHDEYKRLRRLPGSILGTLTDVAVRRKAHTTQSGDSIQETAKRCKATTDCTTIDAATTSTTPRPMEEDNLVSSSSSSSSTPFSSSPSSFASLSNKRVSAGAASEPRRQSQRIKMSKQTQTSARQDS